MKAYLEHLHRRGLTRDTIERRRRGLDLLTEHAQPRGLLEVTREDIESFLDLRDVGARTRYHWISHFHAFYGWALNEGLVELDPTVRIERPKLPRLLPRPLTEGDLAMALEAANSTMGAWVTLGAYAGLRCCEIASLRAEAVLWDQGLLRVTGKGSVERLVPIHPLVEAALHLHGVPKSGFVFRRPMGSRYPAAMVSREGSLYFEGLGIAATMHQCRHYFATRTLEACGDLRVVQELLGHASITSTTIYAQFSNARAREAVMALGSSSAAAIR